MQCCGCGSQIYVKSGDVVVTIATIVMVVNYDAQTQKQTLGMT